MFDFFSDLIGYIELFFDYLLGIVESAFLLLTTTANAISIPLGLVGMLPAILGSAVMSVTAIAVVKLIFGR